MQKRKITQAFSGNFIEVVIGFVTIMFITRKYSQEEAGIYFLVMAIVAVLNNLKEGFLQNGFVKYYIESDRDRAVLKSGLVIIWTWDAINMLVFLTISAFVEDLQPFVPFYCMQVVAYSHYRWVCFTHRSMLALKVIFQTNLLVLIISAIGLLIIHLWSLPIAYCMLTASIAYGYSTLSFAENRQLLRGALKTQLDRFQLRRLALFGKYGLLKEVAGSISHYSGIFLSAYFLSFSDTAMLGLAQRYAILISIPGASLSSLIYPVLLKVGIDVQRLKRAASEGIGKMYALLVPLCICICLGSPVLILLLHGQDYGFAAIILIVKVILTTFLLPLGTGFSSIMNVLNRPQKITQLVGITSLFNIVSMLLLMPILGIWGAILSPALTEVVGFLIMKRGMSVIQLNILDISIQVMQFWRYWIKKYFHKSSWNALVQ